MGIVGVLLQHQTLADAPLRDREKTRDSPKVIGLKNSSRKSRKHHLLYSRMLWERKNHRDDDWCFRNVIEHAIDPAWERCTYCVCHWPERKKIAKELDKKKNDVWIFDVVQPAHNPPSRRYVVRSAFQVTEPEPECFWWGKKRGPDLKFKNYFFVPVKSEPIPIPKTYQNPKKWNGKIQNGIWFRKPWIVKNLRDKVINNYQRRARAQIPSRIRSTASWKAMTAIARLGSHC